MKKSRKKGITKVKKGSYVQELLDRIHEDNITEIEPVYNPEKGCNGSYPVIESVFGTNVKIEPILDEIAEKKKYF